MPGNRPNAGSARTSRWSNRRRVFQTRDMPGGFADGGSWRTLASPWRTASGTPRRWWCPSGMHAASVYLELETDGALAGHEADTFRMFDRPGLPLLNLGSATAADKYLAWAGWFELYTTERLTASAWVDYYEKPMSSEWGVNWVRHLDVVEAPMPRADIEFPDFSGRPSVKWRAG